jgi:competence protein CoiA
MALYAVDEEDLIFAAHAESGRSYWCLECFSPVKVRRGRNRFPHFYHLKTSPRCRLYSKSEDHLRAQIQLQKLFPENCLQIERPFPDICRVADLCWEDKKIVFEIQCSQMTPQEATSRIHDYRLMGYEIVWLLDDRRYNRSILRPEEKLLRTHLSFYLSLKQGLTSTYYDQFEIFAHTQRVKKSHRLKIDLKQPRHLNTPSTLSTDTSLPTQIQQRLLNTSTYFIGDRVHLALQSYRSPSISISMQNWRILEIRLGRTNKPEHLWKKRIYRYIG